MTLSQVGLAKRFGKSAKWIRAKGHQFILANGNGVLETWESQRFSSGRLAGYKIIAGRYMTSEEIAASKSKIGALRQSGNKEG